MYTYDLSDIFSQPQEPIVHVDEDFERDDDYLGCKRDKTSDEYNKINIKNS